jgi:hypothetical protein
MTTVNVPNASSVANASSFVDIGRDIGLRLALEILTRETARQNHRGEEAAANPLKGEAAQHHYAAYVLEDAAKQVGAAFRRCAA